MWMMVMFDLPVVEAEDRKASARFRKDLLDMGFTMSQFSVYFRFCGTREKAEPYINKVRALVPPKGSVSLLFFTDKQFGDIITIQGRKPQKMPEQPSLFDLF
jgi:CRISPR-associated protein Cas2